MEIHSGADLLKSLIRQVPLFTSGVIIGLGLVSSGLGLKNSVLFTSLVISGRTAVESKSNRCCNQSMRPESWSCQSNVRFN